MPSAIVLISGIIAGMILFQSAINAPLLFKSLSIEQARPILRSIFPILFRIVAVLGIAICALSLLANGGTKSLTVGALTFVLSFICAALVPATNRAADEKDQTKFDRLHRISVSLTVIVLIVNLAWVFV